MNETNELIQYDVVHLPSQGIFYPDKRKTLKVAYLNATDENVLAASNLLENDQLVDEILKRKCMDKGFDVTQMPEEDKQAVLIFLRNTAFGSTYTLRLYDDETEQNYEVDVDLGSISTKPFELQMDDNGEFSLELPKSKAKIKFKFLTPKQEDEIKKMKDNPSGPDKIVPVITKSYEMAIKEVNGSRDQMGIYQFIQQMPITDSQFFRKVLREQRPGLDLTYTVKTPKGREVQVGITFGVEFFRPFWGL